MNTEESEVYEFLKRFPRRHLTADDIAEKPEASDEFIRDRNWVLAVLRRMEIEGWVESDAQGGYRVRPLPEETTSFKKALETPGTPLGDTTIISLEDVKAQQAEAV